ncbi:MAG: lipid kinase, partial [Prevotella sp.]|nr:lipid kinase [Prevotella sp.]
MNNALNKWGILYCPKGGIINNPKKRWERIEAALRDCRVDYDFVQCEQVNGVERLVKMMINNGYKTIVIVG